MRPSSRNTSSGRYGEGQPSRPARSRPSRDAVDRAWENGASRQHADYHPRQNAPRPPAQRQGRPSPGFERSQPHYERRGPAYRQEGYGEPSSQPYRSEYRPQRPEMGSRRPNSPGHYAPGGRPGPNSQRWNRDGTPQQSGYRRDRYQDERPPRFTQDGPGGARRSSYRGENDSRPFDRSQRERENFAHGKRTGAPHPGRDSYNPRWQSRPSAQRDYTASQGGYPAARRDYPTPRNEYPHAQPERPAPWQERSYGRPGSGQFEGDYEHFATSEQVERSGQDYERPVTRMPDGRVLKGSRPSQRKQARFWTDVEEETSALLPPMPASPEQVESAPPPPPTTKEAPADKPARPRKQPASQGHKVKAVKTTRRSPSTRSGAGEEKVSKKKARGQQGPITHPSHKGYKWPTSEE